MGITIKHKIVLPMFGFFERQLQTKTGQAQVLALCGSLVAAATGQIPWQGGVVAVWATLTAMFIRDGKAKQEQIERKAARVYRGSGDPG